MEKAISVTEARRRFAEIMREVRIGHTVVLTEQDRPVVKISPASKSAEARLEARSSLFRRLRTQPTVNVGGWMRNQLYE